MINISIKGLFIVILFFQSLQIGNSQNNNPIQNSTNKVFFIGEEEKQYEKIIEQYNHLLFSVCNNSMEDAYDNWSLLLKDIESYSFKTNFDLRGIKIWLNVFWAKDGTIDYIVFHPKPNSKNLNYDELKVFFNNFIKQYQMPLKHSQKFAHFSSASFPTFSKTNIAREK